MPLHENAESLIRANLKLCEEGRKPRLVIIGFLTQKQLAAINEERETRELPPLNSDVIFDGRHMYKSRCQKDGYTIEDIVDQIVSALDETAEFQPHTRQTTIVATSRRKDRYGNEVLDQAVFECTGRYPRAELYSVIPRDDKVRPRKKAQNADGPPKSGPSGKD